MCWFARSESSVPDTTGLRETSKIAMKVAVSEQAKVFIRLKLTKRGPRCNSGQKAGIDLATCLCLHAEENALLEAGRERIREGSILYCNT